MDRPWKVKLSCQLPVGHLEAPGEERVVLLLGMKLSGYYRVLQAVPVPNVALDPTQDFAVAQKDVQQVMRGRRLKIIGVLHTHLRDMPPVPSPADREGLPSGLLGGVYKDGSIVWFINEKTP